MNICKHRRAIALFLALALCLGMLPTAFAAQGLGYYDPAERWVTSSNRTNELDSNAIVSRETFHCCDCNKDTIFAVYRTPEYSRDGASALSRNVMYSDGTTVDEQGRGYILDGTPGVDAYYTGYHWTKAVCETCGTINSNMGMTAYCYNKSIYRLNDCATEFFQNIPESVSYECADSRYHTKTTKSGDYCIFCFGTLSATVSKLERHDLTSAVQTQLANQRFVEVETCADCGYSHTGYLAAKAVISSYYGVADGRPHTVTVSDLSDAGVSTAIRYGNTANSCTLTSAPNYTEAGEYTVYYEITYTYGGQSMTENGVAYVQLRPQEPNEPPANLLECPKHSYALVSTVPATCTSLGYNRYLCTVCGATENRDYTAALGHSWQDVTVREASCGVPGKAAHICTRCGQVNTFEIPAVAHSYNLFSVPATCTSSGYEAEECSICGERHILSVADRAAHQYIATTTPATCMTSGRTTYRCTFCGDSYTDAYIEPLGHTWDLGKVITPATCTTDGVKEYRCTRCNVTTLEAIPATGHTPGKSDICGQPDTCTVCGTTLNATTFGGNGAIHNYIADTTTATCTTGGRTTYRCTHCGDSYTDAYTEPLGHSWDLGTVITPATCTTDGVKEHRCTRCSATTLEAIPANGHDYDEIVTPATCQTEGTITRRCKNCGESKTIGYMAALGHAWDGGTAVTVSNCTGDGVTEYRCTRCDAHYLAADSAAGHTPGPAATCTQAQVCTVCGVVLAGPIGHTYEKTVIPPTCLEGGKTVIACADCDSAYEIDPTQPLGHDWDAGTPITTATCTGEGVMEHKCTRCNDTYLEAQSAAGHTSGPAATCTQPQVCADCGAVLKKPLGHSYKATVTAPTCEKMGFTTYTCAACGDSYKSDYTNPTGHKAGDWIVDKAATTYAQGQKHKECTVCKKVLETAVIEKLYMTATTDTHGEAVVDGYLVTVTDTDTRQPVSGAEVVLDKKDGLTVLLPARRLLDYNDQTTITVRLVRDGSAVSALAVAVTDKNDNYAADTTDRAGKITVPQGSTITNGDGKATVGWQDADRDRHTLTVKVTDFETTRPIVGADVSIGKTGSITVTLPRKVDMDEDNRITVTVTNHKQTPQEGLTVIVKADLGQREEGQTDKGGVLTVPAMPVEAQEHGAYIVGYDNGNFGPEDNMTRGEAAAIFARLLAQRKGEHIYPTTYAAYSDIPAGAWYGPYARYLTSYGVTYGRGNGTFAGDELISRAEFVTMATRFFSVYGDGAPDLMEQYKSFDDVAEGYWAARYIQTAAARGWINGYSDGLFYGGANITRAEAVTVVNRLLGREADRDYIKANLRKLVTFPDVSTRHWAYYTILEAATGHVARPAEAGESWNKK